VDSGDFGGAIMVARPRLQRAHPARTRTSRAKRGGGRSAAKTEKLAAFAFGVLFVIVLLVLAIWFKEPTPFQYLVFRVVLALAAAGVAAMIPGFLEVRLGRGVRAGGALAVFVIVYFYDPAEKVINPPHIIQGTVIDSVTKRPVSGATVIVEGYLHIKTANDGTYKGVLNVKQPSSFPMMAIADGYLNATEALVVDHYEERVDFSIIPVPSQ